MEKADSAFSKNTFVKDTAKKTGKSETVIKEEVRISKNIAPDLKPKLKELGIPKTVNTSGEKIENLLKRFQSMFN